MSVIDEDILRMTEEDMVDEIMLLRQQKAALRNALEALAAAALKLANEPKIPEDWKGFL